MRPVRVLAILFLALSAFPQATDCRLSSPADRTAFLRWFTFLAESRYYARHQLREIIDGESLVRWAMRHALANHDQEWFRRQELPVVPAMASVQDAAPAASPALSVVSRNLDDAQPGDILVFRQSTLAAHVMIYIGRSQVVPSSEHWVIYLDGKRVHKLSIESLRSDPSPEWRPLASNPDFVGVERLAILGAG
jgi:uncharacterized protein YfaT (DUF1175 family)